MDVRENLVELIGSTEYGNGSLVGNNFQKGFIEKIASNHISHGVTVQEWVSVDDRLPDSCGFPCLLCGDNSFGQIRVFVKVLQVIWNAASLNGTAIKKTLISMYGR